MASYCTYILVYEGQPYKDGYPQREVDSINLCDELKVCEPFTYLGDCFNDFIYIGQTKYTHDDLLNKICTADQILKNDEGSCGFIEIKK